MAHCARAACGRWRPGALTRWVGLTFENAWYCSTGCLEAVVRARLVEAGRERPPGPIAPPHKIGVLLIHQGTIGPTDVEAALTLQERTGLRLGAQLRELGRVSSDDILRALAAQARVSYLTAVNLGRVRQGPGDLSRQTIRALGVVPFEADPDRQRMKVACMAPVPRVSLSALRAVTGWDAGPYLVADEQWPSLVEAYGEGRVREEDGDRGGFVETIDEASARVAAIVETGKFTRMIHTVGDPWLWVRLEGDARSEDLVVSSTRIVTETLWQAAHT